MEIKEKGIVKNGFFTVLQILVTSFTYIVIYYLILNRNDGGSGKEKIGLVTTITNIPATLTVFGSGVSGCMVRYIPMYMAEKSYRRVKQLIINGWLFNALLASLICFAGWLFCDPLLSFFFKLTAVPELYRRIFLLSLLTFFLNFTGAVFNFSLDGLQMIYKRNIILMAVSVVFSLLAILFIHFTGIVGLVYAQIIQAALMVILSFGAVFKTGVFRVRAPLINVAQQKLFLTYGSGLQLINFSIMFYDPIIRFFLNRFYTLELVGMYDIVNRTITQARTLVVSAIQAIVPVVSRQHKEQSLNVADLTQKSIRGSALLSTTGFCWLVLIAIPFIVYTGDRAGFGYYVTFLIALALAYLVNIVSSGPYSIMTVLGELRPVVASHVISTLINGSLFLAIGSGASRFFIIFPPAAAVALSSLYIIVVFFRKHGLRAKLPVREDLRVYGMAIVSLPVALLVYERQGTLEALMITNVLLAIGWFVVLWKNRFLAGIREKLFLKV